MIVVAEDVLAGVKAVWNAHALLPSLVVGGLHYGRAPENASGVAVVSPYAVAIIEEGDQEDFSGSDFIKTFTVRIDGYSDVTSSTSDTSKTLRRTMAELLDRSSSLVIPNATTLHVKPLAGKLELATERRNANDVIIASGAWEVLVQGTR